MGLRFGGEQRLRAPGRSKKMTLRVHVPTLRLHRSSFLGFIFRIL